MTVKEMIAIFQRNVYFDTTLDLIIMQLRNEYEKNYNYIIHHKFFY